MDAPFAYQCMRFAGRPSGRDLFIAWCWLPIFVATAACAMVQTAAGNAAVVTLLGVAFTISVLHQPLTLLVIAGDRSAFLGKRRWLLWAPLVGLPFLAVAVVAKLWIVVPIAATWQIYHTQQQRYGMLRRYDRKSGTAWDRLITYVPFSGALVALASLPLAKAHLRIVGHRLGQNNFRAIRATLDAVPQSATAAGIMLALTCIVIVAYGVRDLRRPVSLVKWNYLLSGFALLAGLVLCPAAGLVAYLVAHAGEYLGVVHQRVAARWTSRLGPAVGMVGVVAAVMLTSAMLSKALPGRGYMVVTASIGALHFFYDGLVWRRG